MKLKEAIETATGMIEWEPGYLKSNESQALKILIEAGKREEKRRRFAVPDKVDLLPGED